MLELGVTNLWLPIPQAGQGLKSLPVDLFLLPCAPAWERAPEWFRLGGTLKLILFHPLPWTTDEAFDAFYALPSQFILGFFGFSTEKAQHSGIDRDQRLVRSCSAPKLHLLGFFLVH